LLLTCSLLGQDFGESDRLWTTHFTEGHLDQIELPDAMNAYIAKLGDHVPITQVLKASASQVRHA
jgi:hypothetical protein